MEDGIESWKICFLEYAPVKIAVDRRKAIFVFFFSSLQHIIQHDPKIVDQMLRLAGHDTQNSIAFYRVAKPEHLHGFVGSAQGNLRASVSLPQNEPLFLQLKQRFSNRALAAPKMCRYFQFRKIGACGQSPKHYILLKRFKHDRRFRRSALNEFR